MQVNCLVNSINLSMCTANIKAEAQKVIKINRVLSKWLVLTYLNETYNSHVCKRILAMNCILRHVLKNSPSHLNLHYKLVDFLLLFYYYYLHFIYKIYENNPKETNFV